MDGYGSGHQRRPYGYDNRRPEVVVSWKNADLQIYRATRATGPEPEGTTGGSGWKPWGLGDPEMKRKKRIAGYKAYAVEGKVKASLRRGLHWIKNKCTQMIHGH